MRTTIDIDDDILAVAKDIAKAEGKTMSMVISELARRGLTAPSFAAAAERGTGAYGTGFAEPQVGFDAIDWPTFPMRAGPPVTSDMIDRIQDELDREDLTPFDHAS